MADNILDFLINEADCDFSAKLSSVTFEETIAKVKEFLMLDLKPCPFCGADAELNFGHVSTSDDVESLAYVICRTCGAKSANHHASSDAQAKKLALHAWNMRGEPMSYVLCDVDECYYHDEKKPPIEAKGDCTVCKGWKDDGRGGLCVFAIDYWQPGCPYDKAVKR